MRGLVVVAMLVGCTSTTVQQNDVQTFCQIACDCGLFEGAGANCPQQCASSVGSQPIPDACMSCLYEYEHECSAIGQVCEPECQTEQSMPPVQGLEGGGP